jgi:hypothetical protein
METDRSVTELTDQRFEEILNDDTLIDDFAFQYRMYLLQMQQEAIEGLKGAKGD